MAYVKQTWTNGSPSGGLTATSQVNAERMGYLEDGILGASTPSASSATADTSGGLDGPSVQDALQQLHDQVAQLQANATPTVFN